ncbi:ABC transporter permease [Oceanispirochaeta crateris]|uniref:ABC transporter permease n=1 Tax=Oceanispirochaeta crateris TaxID=2518645 RepID=A0A5C1QP86_9SPIO|nr:ABC transporter permease [Oceanispirochaeta crateris]
MPTIIKRLSRRNETYVFIVLIGLCLLIEIRSGQFFSSNNLVDISSAMIVPGLFAIGAFLVLISGGIDVSFPALASLSAYATTKLLLVINYNGSIWAAILLALFIGAILGAFNGLFIAFFNLPALIVTLGTASVFKGIMQGALNSKQLTTIPAGMVEFGKKSLFIATNSVSGLTSRMPFAFLFFLLVLALTSFILRYTMFGRGIYCIGGSETSAIRAGVRVKRTKFIMYILVGMIVSVAGIFRASMMQQFHPTNMLGMELNIIAGIVLGGTLLTGGKGTLFGAILGTLLIVVVENSLILIGVPTTFKNIFIGSLIIIGTSVSIYQSTNMNGIGNKKFTKRNAV